MYIWHLYISIGWDGLHTAKLIRGLQLGGGVGGGELAGGSLLAFIGINEKILILWLEIRGGGFLAVLLADCIVYELMDGWMAFKKLINRFEKRKTKSS
jgi:hypothetical protein